MMREKIDLSEINTTSRARSNGQKLVAAKAMRPRKKSAGTGRKRSAAGEIGEYSFKNCKEKGYCFGQSRIIT